MVSIQQAKQHTIEHNVDFIKKAKDLKTTLIRGIIYPSHIVEVIRNDDAVHGWEVKKKEKASSLSSQTYGKGDQFILDFGTHQVGYIKMKVTPIGSPPDAPLHLKLTFGEMPIEMAEPFSTYSGWISSSWLQEETMHIDALPNNIELSRRYSFRYVKVEVLDTSTKYKVTFDDIQCHTVTSANPSDVPSFPHKDELIHTIDKVSMKTLQDCMQEVFEDGPKRDRRLWLGDLRLQALANYKTFQNNDLVKRCLYLFAGVTNTNGQVAANLFISPKLIPDDTYLFDYSLLFVTTLHDYYFYVKDENTLKDLWPTAYQQIEISLTRLNEQHIVQDSETWWSFIDWNDDLNKQAASQAILIYAIKHAIKLAEFLEDEKVTCLKQKLKEITEATKRHLWDKDKKFFISGENRQVSWASQIWMVLAEVLGPKENNELLHRLLSEKPEIGITTPYMYHYLVEALLLVNEKEKAIEQIKTYWGEMVKDGADTFWELYNPKNKSFSPYGSPLINSYCHAWSCTPTYFIREYNM